MTERKQTNDAANIRDVAAMPPDSAAAYWDARLRSPDCGDGERADFCAWRDADPEHAAAFETLQAVLGGLRDQEDAPEMRAMRDAALNFAHAKNRTRLFAQGAGLAASLAVVITAVIFAWNGLGFREAPARLAAPGEPIHLDAPPFFATAIGERSTVTLEDGTVATLNTNTRLRVDYSDSERLVTLLEGQALFDVAKNPDRPFVVAAGDQRIAAVGTIFDVKYIADEVEVTLLEGLVAVTDKSKRRVPDGETARQFTAQLTPGQQLLAAASGGSPIEIRDTDPERAVIWREGRVFFEDVALPEAVAEMNRYSTTQIIVADSRLQRLRINGMFFTGQQANFAAALEGYFPIEVNRETGGEIVIKMSRGL